MKEKMIQLVQYLNGQAGFTDVVGARLFPGVANKDTPYPFVVYTIGSTPLTKEGRGYNGAIQLFFEPDKFTEMVDFADTCTTLLNAKFDVQNVDTDFSEEHGVHFTTITFNF